MGIENLFKDATGCSSIFYFTDGVTRYGGSTLTLVKTMCTRDCPDACFLDVEVNDDVIVSVRASSENPVTAGITRPRALGDPQRVYLSLIHISEPTRPY